MLIDRTDVDVVKGGMSRSPWMRSSAPRTVRCWAVAALMEPFIARPTRNLSTNVPPARRLQDRTGKANGWPRLPARHIIHTVGPAWRGGMNGGPELLESCYGNSLRIADDRSLRRIAFPAISTGIYGYPLDAAARVAVETVTTYIEDRPDAFDEILLVCFGADASKAFETALAARDNI